MLLSQEDVPGEHHLKNFKWNSPHIVVYHLKRHKKETLGLNRKLIRWAVQKLLKIKIHFPKRPIFKKLLHKSNTYWSSCISKWAPL